ncbi:MAG: hypothetical protein WDN49_24870 [Acetobacteraceae bacterium]
MVFQHFNLLASLTVAANVAFPLAIAGMQRAQQRERVAELLGLVGCPARPTPIPGICPAAEATRRHRPRPGQPPSLLLCDEATSALDPETTGEILALLRGPARPAVAQRPADHA